VHLEISSRFELLDFVQIVSDRVGRELGFDEETLHWVGVAIRESVINAIRHGNRGDPAKYVFVDLGLSDGERPPRLLVRVRDQGPGFDPSTVADPLLAENVLKSSGRGIFIIRSFMDDVHLGPAPEGGMEVRMAKRVPTT
jgi:serine/threonine-protein kinase RsbW